MTDAFAGLGLRKSQMYAMLLPSSIAESIKFTIDEFVAFWIMGPC